MPTECTCMFPIILTKAAIFSLSIFNPLVFIIVTQYVYCEEGTEYLCIIQIGFVFRRVMSFQYRLMWCTVVLLQYKSNRPVQYTHLFDLIHALRYFSKRIIDLKLLKNVWPRIFFCTCNELLRCYENPDLRSSDIILF